jgi:hypothetical protein
MMRNSVVLPAPLGPILVQQFVAVGLLAAVDFDDDVTEPRAGRDVKFLGFGALLVFLRGQLLEALETRLALRLTPLGVGVHPFEFRFHRFHARLFGALLVLEALFLLFQPGRIISFPGDAVAAVEFENPAGDVVEKVSIVGNRDHGAGKVLQESFQPGHRFGVEVVGGFVQDQHVRVRQQ